jgi:hypothetical protein
VEKDDNEEIIFEILKGTELRHKEQIVNLVLQRLNVGIERYGHGVRVLDDTTQYGTENNDWLEMFNEEAGDGIVYIAAKIVEMQKKGKPYDGATVGRLRKAMSHFVSGYLIVDSVRRENGQ